MKKQSKTFAFKLSSKPEHKKSSQKWSARPGVAVAGCTDPFKNGDYRWSSPSGGFDNSDWC